jgi:hypothetical protein
MWIVVGLLPYLGLAARGDWSERELGISALILIIAGRALLRDYGQMRCRAACR